MPTELSYTHTQKLSPADKHAKQPPQPLWIKVIATIFSYVFHPIFVPVYVIVFLTFISPFLFTGFLKSQIAFTVGHAVLMYTFFPLITVLLLKALNFISSITLTTQKDRIIPFIASGIWYFWVWYVWRNGTLYPREVVLFTMAVFLASSIGLMLNIYMKVSMHAIAIGTALSYLCLLGLYYPWGVSPYLPFAFLIGGAVCTSRLLLAAHTAKEMYGGLAAGVVAVLVASIFV